MLCTFTQSYVEPSNICTAAMTIPQQYFLQYSSNGFKMVIRKSFLKDKTALSLRENLCSLHINFFQHKHPSHNLLAF